jgi:hypothetical protein
MNLTGDYTLYEVQVYTKIGEFWRCDRVLQTYDLDEAQLSYDEKVNDPKYFDVRLVKDISITYVLKSKLDQ